MTSPVSYLGVEPPYRTTFRLENYPYSLRGDAKDLFGYYFNLLRRLNKGTHQRNPTNRFKTWTDQQWLKQSDNLHIFDNVASRTVLQEGQKKRAKKLYNQLDYRRYERRSDKGKGMVVVALAACIYIGWKDGLPCHPNSPKVDVWFGEAVDAYEVTQKRLQKTFGRLQYDAENHQKLKVRPFDVREPDKADGEDNQWEGGI